MSKPLAQISQAGVAVWLDDLSRDRINNGSLKKLIAEDNVVGVTTNPSIFAVSIGKSDLYENDILQNKVKSIEDIITKLTTDDVRNACDLFQTAFKSSDGVDGRVSIEVDPRFARDTLATVKQGKQLWEIIDRSNPLIKVPATVEGLPAITELIANGISVNVTLIFSVNRYKQVLNAFASGLEKRLSAAKEINEIHSVASFFVSRIDTEIDKQLPANSDLRGLAAIANAVMAYEAFLTFEKSDRWRRIEARGGKLQRPLWASTGVKDPAYDSTRYVMQLVARNTVNTMPEATLNAVKSSGVFMGDTITPNISISKNYLAKLALARIDLEKITNALEVDGVAKFEVAWIDLMNSVKSVIARS
ncbi:MAG: transaldolase [Actinomycetota bacterium]|nr:transaldolase [Actinomycetota bacterium]